MSLQAIEWSCVSEDRPKPCNVVRPLPRLSRDELMTVAYEEARSDPSLRLEARCKSPEIAGGCWHVVAAIPGQEMIAAAHLIARHAAVYLPIKDGKPFLPGYLFVFAWGIDAQWRKILGAPGIGGVLASGERMRPIPDGVIDYLRVREAGWEAAKEKGRLGSARRGWRRWIRGKDVDLPPVFSVTVEEWQPKLRVLEDVPVDERAGLFAAAMGLAP